MVTEVLNPEQYGVLSLLVAVQTFFGLLFLSPVGQHISLNAHRWADEGVLKHYLSVFGFYVVAVALLGSVVGCFAIGLSQFGVVYASSGLAIFLAILGATLNGTYVWLLNLLHHASISTLFLVATAGAALGMSVTLATGEGAAFWWLIGQALAMLGIALVARGVLNKKVANVSAHAQHVSYPSKELLAFCLPLAATVAVIWVQTSGYRFLVGREWGAAQLGLVALGLQLAVQMGSVVESLAIQAVYPAFYRRCKLISDERSISCAFSDMLNVLAPIYIIVAGLVVATSASLTKVLVSVNYPGASQFLALGAGIELMRVLTSLLSSAAHGLRDTRILLLPACCGSGVAVISVAAAAAANVGIIWALYGLLLGAVTTLVLTALSVAQRVSIAIDAARWLAAVAVALLLISVAAAISSHSTYFAALANLALFGLCATAAALLIMWRNDAAARLLAA
ncbi:oligosaccharide flippase family protein [Ramlibacter sp. AN1015]|uniref:oligosaccharide flippase family protein n=1 Tax=Ramlibacter sp. AN1015 TaxID=3133428 RepID=UPI0030C29DDF